MDSARNDMSDNNTCQAPIIKRDVIDHIDTSHSSTKILNSSLPPDSIANNNEILPFASSCEIPRNDARTQFSKHLLHDKDLQEPSSHTLLPVRAEEIPTSASRDVEIVSSFSSLSSTGHKPREKSAKKGEEGAKKRKKHKRERSFLIRLTVSLKDAHMMRHPWDTDVPERQFRKFGDECDNDDDDDDPHQQAYVTPDFKHLFYLTAALMLCTCMAVFSAYDAELHCRQHEALAVWQLVDDDAVPATTTSVDEHDPDNYKCIQMFRDVVLPTGIATAISALLVLGAIFLHIRQTSAATMDSTSDSESHASQDGVIATSASATTQEWQPIIRVTGILFFLFVVILGLQTYNVTAVMLKPRADLMDDDADSNPYQSLAAVDRYGHVGDNANLYYLVWLSEGLAISLVYQVATAFFRVLRAARQKDSDGLFKAMKSPDIENIDQADGVAKGKKSGNAVPTELLRATSWDRGLTESQRIRKRMFNDQSRAAWYSSLYRLRVRTGMWTAACISCLIIIASSQYIWRQVLWPYISSIVQHHQDDPDFSYFSICQTATTYSSAYSSRGFSSQLCRRTLAAWCSGLVAAILCATAIAMHQIARYSPNVSMHQDHQMGLDAANNEGRSGRDGLATDGTISSQLYYDHDVVQLLTTPNGLCPTTTSAWKNALPGALLSRYYSHHHPKRLPLRTELGLAFLLSIVLGINAVLVTGVQGPALKVGNLYYSSWLSFMLCVRICLGCVEEFYNLIEVESVDAQGTVTRSSSGNGSAVSGRMQPYQAPELSSATLMPTVGHNGVNGDVPVSNSMGSKVSGQSSLDALSSVADSQEQKRLSRVRGFFFLSIFSSVCAASSYDAAANQYRALSREQEFMMYIPRVVAAISLLLFFLSLSKGCYSFISQFWIGGILSIVSFSLLLGDLLLTMHSEDSWAVNSIGEIAMANLYYFAWASIITAGIQMTSYLKALFGIEKLDYMSAVWVAICKVCFVILGAALHIWHTISENCEFDEITLGAVSFCSRTILAIVVSWTGMLVGGLVVVGRLMVTLCPVCQCGRFQAHVEMLISLFLMFLFVAAVALITGIGGPGQSVGDLYYSTWVAFWVSLGIFVSCYNQLNEKEKEIDGQETDLGGLKAAST